MKQIKKTLIFKVGGNSYEVSQPNMGQIIDVESLRAQITNGNYGRIVGNLSDFSIMSLDVVDMFTHLKVFCPQLLKDLKVENWADLDVFDTLDLLKAYTDQFKPWYAPFSEKAIEVWKSITDSIVEDQVKDEK